MPLLVESTDVDLCLLDFRAENMITSVFSFVPNIKITLVIKPTANVVSAKILYFISGRPRVLKKKSAKTDRFESIVKR